MSVTKIRGTLQGYFEHMTGKTIEAVGTFDDELIILLDDESEVCIWSDDSLSIQINERQELDD
jgi:hypothetical protein